jgi:hypothetical protein
LPLIGVDEPKVMLSKPIWLAVPEKSTDMAVPLKVTPNGTKGQN